DCCCSGGNRGCAKYHRSWHRRAFYRAGSPERAGAPGRRRAQAEVEKDVTLLVDLEALVEPTSRGDPELPLRWTCKSLRRLANELQARGHRVSHTLVGELLENLHYSLQENGKTRTG